MLFDPMLGCYHPLYLLQMLSFNRYEYCLHMGPVSVPFVQVAINPPPPLSQDNAPSKSIYL